MRQFTYRGRQAAIRAGGIMFTLGEPLAVEDSALTPAALRSFAKHNVHEGVQAKPIPKPPLVPPPPPEASPAEGDYAAAYEPKTKKAEAPSVYRPKKKTSRKR